MVNHLIGQSPSPTRRMSVGETAASAGGTVLSVLDEAHAHLQKIFIGFLIGLVGTVWSLRAFLWDYLKDVTISELDEVAAGEFDVIVRTPFDVILLQVKIGIIVGILIVIPMLIYYGRGALRRRDVLPDLGWNRRQQYGFIATSAVLLVLGVIYAYALFFPLMFQFLIENALLMAIRPTFDIVMWTQFLILLTISFGLAAQIPLFMSVASYTEVIRYETFRDKWKYAVVGIFVFGALFSPPDPFTQIMWGVPLVALYVFSLALAKLAASYSRAESAADPAVRLGLRRKAAVTAAIGVLAAVGGLVVARYDLVAAATGELWPHLPASVRPADPWTVDAWLPAAGALGEVGFALGVGVVALLLVLTVHAVGVLRRPIPPSRYAMVAGDPADLDLRPLDAEGLRAAPVEAFAALDEDEAVSIASAALDAGDHERAEVALKRFDEGQAYAEELAAAEPAETEGGGAASAAKSAATGVVDAFTEEETTEDDIGGYYYDLVFIYQSLTSKMFRIVGTFLLVTFGAFFWLFSGGLGDMQRSFTAQLPEDVPFDTTNPEFLVNLHPVEHLLFAVKISLVAGLIVVLPIVLYYAWPAIRERGFASGDRRVFLVWSWLLIAAVAIGSYVGFAFIAPAIISALIFHAVDAGMVVTYRLNSFAWLVVYTTIGVGVLIGFLMSMVLFHVTGIVPYETMRRRWRGVLVWTMILGALLTPGSVLTMLLVVIPVIVVYLVGLGLLWLLTIPERWGPPGLSRA